MSVVALMERMLDVGTIVPVKEHVLESASRHVADVEDKFNEQYDKLVREATIAWGKPEFNNDMSHVRLKNVMPSWSDGIARNGGESRAQRLCYWRKDGIIKYIVLRTEVNDKDTPIYYDLVIGARRKPIDGIRISSLRHRKTGFLELLQSLWASILSRKS